VGVVTSTAVARSHRTARGALAGLLGAAASLAALEVAALADGDGSSVLEAVGNRFVDSFAASLKDVAVALFGTSDKAALQIGTVVVALAIGAWLGTWLDRRPNVLVGGFGAFAVVGALSARSDAQASFGLAIVACAVSALIGCAVAIGLHRRWTGAVSGGAPSPGAEAGELATADPTAPAVPRRTVLVNAGVLGGLLVLGTAAARAARDAARTAVTTVTAALPSPVRRVPVPAEESPLAGISPFVTPTDDFYRIDTALRVPVVDLDGWSVKITGLVERELELTYDDLLAWDLVEVPITMLCVSNEVGGDLVGNARWLGVPLAQLLEEAGVEAGAEQVMGVSVDGFTAGFPVEAALDGREALLAIAMNDVPLPPEHGFPARLVIPGLYGYVSATKWLSEIRLTTWDEEGYWIPRGWSRLGPIKTSSRIDVPRRGADLSAGEQVIAGVAWAPTRGIERVEVQVDDGPWELAELGPVTTADTWVQWWHRWEATPGEHELRVRATDGDGATQTAERARPDPDGATGHHQITVDVA
jgi:DMSO/TMAO reductase YedYZ molybdopterin-dependent catalytic subunit